MTDVIEVNFGVDPGVVFLEALRFVVDLGDGKPLPKVVNTLVELSPEELDAHDGEDKPEDQTHQKHVENGRDGIHQGIHHNL